MKKVISLISLISLFAFLFNSFAIAENPNNKIADGERLVNSLVVAINEQDWNAFSNCFVTSEKENYLQFFNDKSNKESHLGILNVYSAKLKEFLQLPEQACFGATNVKRLNETYVGLNYYLVGIDYSVYSEDKYHYNGVNYRLIVTCQENDQEKIVEMSDAPIENFTEMGYSFKSNDEKEALKIVKRRYKGEFVNKDGKILSLNKASNKGLKIDKGLNTYLKSSPTMIATSANELSPPATIRVRRVSTGRIDTVNLYYYIKNVLPNEWPKQTTYPEANKAGAMCVKMYGWFHVYHPKGPNNAYDLKDNTEGQVYVPGSELTYMTTAINDIEGVGVLTSICTLFETSYLAGTVGQKGTGGTGIVLQNGTVYMAKQKTNNKYLDMLHYYYDNGTDQWHNTNIGIMKTFYY